MPEAQILAFHVPLRRIDAERRQDWISGGLNVVEDRKAEQEECE
jgi:hypothetical protein